MVFGYGYGNYSYFGFLAFAVFIVCILILLCIARSRRRQQAIIYTDQTELPYYAQTGQQPNPYCPNTNYYGPPNQSLYGASTNYPQYVPPPGSPPTTSNSNYTSPQMPPPAHSAPETSTGEAVENGYMQPPPPYKPEPGNKHTVV